MSAMAVAKDLLPNIERATLFGKLPKIGYPSFEQLDCKAVHISTRHVTQAHVDAINRHNFPVRVYTVNDAARGQELREWACRLSLQIALIFSDQSTLKIMFKSHRHTLSIASAVGLRKHSGWSRHSDKLS